MKRKRIALAATVVLAAGIAILLLVAIWPHSPRPLPPLPVPNGYDDLVRAAALVRPLEPGFDEAPLEELRAYIEAHAEPLRIAREGMRKECRAPLEYSREFLLCRNPFILQPIEKLLMAESLLRWREKKFDEAMRCILDKVRLGVQGGRGTVEIERFFADLVEYEGIRSLARFRPFMSPAMRKEAIDALEGIAWWKEPVTEIVSREEDCIRATASALERIELLTLKTFLGQGVAPLQDRYAAYFRLLLADLAIRAYRDDRGKWPDSLEVLVLAYLEEIPLDPFTEEPLIYRTEGEGFVLYSAGPDRRDDGGPEVGGEDIFLKDPEAGDGEEGG